MKACPEGVFLTPKKSLMRQAIIISAGVHKNRAERAVSSLLQEVIMAKMRFDVKCVRDCLVNNGVVFTVRSWEGYSALSKVAVDGIGLCTKKRLLRVTRK